MRGDIAAATAHAAAPSMTRCARSAAIFIARAASSSGTTIDSWTTLWTMGNIEASTDWPPAPSTHERLQFS